MNYQQGQRVDKFGLHHRSMEEKYKNNSNSRLIIEYSDQKGKLQANGRLKEGECTGPMQRFVTGFLSHPESYWAANFQVSACSGVFGKKQQEHAWHRQDIMTAVLYSYLNNRSQGNSHIEQIIAEKLSQNLSGLTGRFMGGMFVTNRALFGKMKTSGGPNGVVKQAGSYTGVAASFLWASYGQFILGIARGLRTFDTLIGYALTGNVSMKHCQGISEKKERELSDRDWKMADDFVAALYELSKQYEQPPTPISEFCAQPKNASLKGICQK